MRPSVDHPPLRIRDAIPGDLEAICAIYNFEVEHGTTTFETVPWTAKGRSSWLEEHQAPGFPLLVATDSGAEVLGWGSLSPWSPRAGYRGTVEVSFFVHRHHRRRGVARELLGRLVDDARKARHRVILGRIEATNAASLRLVRKLGFTSVGVMHRVGVKFGRVLDVEVVELLL